MNDKEIVEYIKCYKAAKSKTEKDEIVGEISNTKIDQFKYLLQFGAKSDWWVQSEIIIALGYPCSKPILDKLFKWLKDLNWPGAVDIYDKLLINVEKKELVKSLDYVIHQAYECHLLGTLQIQGFSGPTTPKQIKCDLSLYAKRRRGRLRAAFLRG